MTHSNSFFVSVASKPFNSPIVSERAPGVFPRAFASCRDKGPTASAEAELNNFIDKGNK